MHIYIILSLIISAIGLIGTIIKRDMILKLINLGVFQSGNVLFFVSIAYKGLSPIITLNIDKYSDPLIHSFLLTVVVIGFANLSLMLVFIMILSNKIKTHLIDEIEDKISRG
ncbi:cation:proton antiporter subunit C [Oceanotoga sp. DSM 15011]|jgi:multisubunit Na+/H+ antiporter MnhC subunit|uniref:Multicomponent Na+:H+ antiporter subunit C n=1 Tax=Oceanotoga teriensis TaxID=515440 RepID=A0AA45C4S2_9BACT|nr:MULTISPECIES: cation:proton antiporter subunit C [Oceanotoga]MDN5343183.1 multicomponent Na+:H+ antiporter subunit [Oceanotoga sp.]MDO7977735.1 cation:proton antiporter subunit C [Oceanotoga teriensis]PWJ87150.1 multicomponent Na+:H+ antiporter subunit C [Oceanotoga teriensis]UYP00734.1 cation:proton antiporter subunit C [Oceanotoga sp. DSM 15011]